VALLLLAGCQNADEIRRYKVPHTEPDVVERPALRTLGAIVPHGDRVWFFKVTGPEKAVAEHKEAFERFMSTVRFTDKADLPVTWKTPDDWQQLPGAGMRFATLRLESKSATLELTVIPLDNKDDAGSVLANVNRWRKLIGLGPVAEGELSKHTREMKLDGVVATLVDLSNSGGGPDAHKGGDVAPSAPKEYKTPDGWKPLAKLPLFSVLAFEVAADGQTAQVSVSPLSGAAGGLMDNVNRWRKQVRLGPAGEAEVRKSFRTLEVAGAPATYVDLSGPESEGPNRLRILGVVAERGAYTWFFKMSGPAGLVGRQQAAFEAFVRSVRFDGGQGGK
jgi:hypothetical protein